MAIGSPLVFGIDVPGIAPQDAKAIIVLGRVNLTTGELRISYLQSVVVLGFRRVNMTINIQVMLIMLDE